MNKMGHIAVVHFSPTGGTRKACLNLVMEMGKKVKDVDLCGLEGECSLGPEDTVIVGVPVLSGRIPGYAAGKPTYLKGGGAVVPTAAICDNRVFGDALLELNDCLKTQRFGTGAGTALLTEHSAVRDVAAGRSSSQNREEAANFRARVLEKLEEEGWQELQVPGNRSYRDWRQMPVTPLINVSCISCGLCAIRCPVQAIPVSNSSSTDQMCCILCVCYISARPVKTGSLPERACIMLRRKLSPVRDIRRENELFL